MKRNIVPLLGIAFVVAIVSTGIFYGLFAGKLRSSVGELPGQSIVVAARNLDPGTIIQATDLRVSEVKGALNGGFSRPEELVGLTVLHAVKQNEPILQERVASRDAKAGQGAGGVPTGMRAVSVRVADSSGIVSLLRPGTKVDVQAVSQRNSTAVAELRTILQNVEVLAVSPQPESGGGNQPAMPVVTFLTRPQDIDLIALADSGARIRIALRNPLDEGTTPRRSMVLASVFESKETATAGSVTASLRSADGWDHPVRLHVQALSVSAAAFSELNSKLDTAPARDSLGVAAFRADADAEQLIRALEQKQEVEVVSSRRLMAGVGRPISYRSRAGGPGRLRVQFAREISARGKLELRVRPEVSVKREGGTETHKYAAGFADEGSYLVQGFFKDQTDRQVLEGIYPGHSWNGRQLVILVTSQNAKPGSSTASLAHTNRGQ